MAPLRTGDGLPDVVVTAVASTTSLAPDAEKTWQYLLEGRSGIRELDSPFVDEFESPVRIGGPAAGKFRRASDPCRAASAVVHAEDVDCAGAATLGHRRHTRDRHQAADGFDRARAGLYRGNSVPVRRPGRRRACARCPRLPCRCTCPMRPPRRSGWTIRPRPGIVSPVMADASGGAAIAQAWRHIVLGEADIAICGGVETDDRGGARRGVLADGHVVDEQRRSARRMPPVR